MNLLEHYVTEVLDPPYFKYGRWWVKVNVEGVGSAIQDDAIMCKTKEEALAVGVGYMYLA